MKLHPQVQIVLATFSCRVGVYRCLSLAVHWVVYMIDNVAFSAVMYVPGSLGMGLRCSMFISVDLVRLAPTMLL